MNDHQSLINMLIQAEGNIPYLYLDTRGLVTVGIGHMLADPVAATKLPFKRTDGLTASSTEIQNEFRTVKAQEPAHVASYYKPFTKLHLEADAVMALLNADIAATEKSVTTQYAVYPTYPNSPQDALCDMCFNLGPGGLKKYTKLRAAAELKDWKACADECHRNGVSD